ncbi:hypothetical protein MSKOL_0685 [Methanosarcina sp. Kolksee]|nr:hypothetical protein MSKOL_0685 [Methanosarcina sp. Kolksee]
MIFSFWGEFLIESELLITFNSIEIYFSCQRTLGSSPNKVVNQSETEKPQFFRVKSIKFKRSPSQGLFEKSDLSLCGDFVIEVNPSSRSTQLKYISQASGHWDLPRIRL